MDFHPEHFTVWTEIPSADVDRAVPFYETVLMTKLEKTVMGPDTTFVFRTWNHPNGIAGGTIYTAFSELIQNTTPMARGT